MIRHIWSILCERIIIDQKTNLISYLTCIEELVAKKLPAVGSLFALGSLWQTDSPKEDILKFRWILVSPKGIEKKMIESKDFILEKESYRTNIILNGISFDSTGIYVFRLQTELNNKWKTMTEIPIKVLLKSNKEKN